MEFDWIEEYDKKEGIYDDLYQSSVNQISVFYLYINKENEIFHIKKETIDLVDGSLKKIHLVYILRNNIFYNCKKYKPTSLIKYNVNLEPEEISKYIKNSEDFDFISKEQYTNTIHWKDTIPLFHDLNSLYIIFQEVVSNNNTKKIYIHKTSKTKKNRYIRHGK